MSKKVIKILEYIVYQYLIIIIIITVKIEIILAFNIKKKTIFYVNFHIGKIIFYVNFHIDLKNISVFILKYIFKLI